MYQKDGRVVEVAAPQQSKDDKGLQPPGGFEQHELLEFSKFLMLPFDPSDNPW